MVYKFQINIPKTMKFRDGEIFKTQQDTVLDNLLHDLKRSLPTKCFWQCKFGKKFNRRDEMTLEVTPFLLFMVVISALTSLPEYSKGI